MCTRSCQISQKGKATKSLGSSADKTSTAHLSSPIIPSEGMWSAGCFYWILPYLFARDNATPPQTRGICQVACHSQLSVGSGSGSGCVTAWGQARFEITGPISSARSSLLQMERSCGVRVHGISVWHSSSSYFCVIYIPFVLHFLFPI